MAFTTRKIPGLQWRNRKNGQRVAYWICLRKNARTRTQRLWAGIEPTTEEMAAIERQCRRLQAEMLDRIQLTSQPRGIGLIYFFSMGKYVKIGFTTNLKLRRRTLQTHLPERGKILLKLPGSLEDEKRIHRRFKHIRSSGEWFLATPELYDFIKQNG